jgi:hypothetical protein
MKTLKEQIEIMTHFMNGGRVESIAVNGIFKSWEVEEKPSFSWGNFDYRIIKEEKKTITIEKWLLKEINGCYSVLQVSPEIAKGDSSFIKLLETYEVEL